MDETIKLLEAYSRWLEKYGYMDSDWWAEEPRTVEAFLIEAKDFKRK